MAFALDTLTMHGIGRVFVTESRGAKMFWSLIFLLSLFLATYGSMKIIQEFLDYTVVMSVKTEFRESMSLPVVTICNGLRMYDSDQNSSFSRGSVEYINVHKGHCLFGSGHCSPMPQKNSLDPEPFCVSVNQNQTTSQLEPVVQMGLQYEFFLNVSDKLERNISNTLERSISRLDPLTEAVKIYLHSKGVYPILMNNDLIAKPGYLTKIILRKKKFKRLPSPYHSNCIIENLKKTVDFFPGSYTLNGCRFSHRARQVYEKCGFVMYVLDKYFPYHEYESRTVDRACFNNVAGKVVDDGNTGDCQPLCNEDVYEVEALTEVKWPIGSEMERMKNITYKAFGFMPSDEYILSNFGRIVIGYNKFEEKVVEEIEKQTIESVISSIGGLLGIFLGASFISLTEIFVAGISILIAKSKNENYSVKETGDIKREAVDLASD